MLPLMNNDTTTSGPSSASSDRLPPDLLRLGGAIMFGAFMVALDMTMVNVALHTLARDFSVSVTTIQWVATGYLLSLAMVIPITGWVIERFGARASWTLALSLFTGGSVLCGLAWSAGSLIAFRVLQGLGGGMLLPLAQTILAQAAGPGRMGRLIAVIGIPAMLGPVLGPVLGGVIVTETTWRLMFYLNVPVCIAALLVAARVQMPETRTADRGGRLDAVGLALLSPGLAAIVYGLSESGVHGGFTGAHVVVPIAAGVVLLGAFAFHALRFTNPLIDLRLFRARTFSVSSAVVLVFSMAMLGVQLLMPLYYQQVRGASALDAGLLLAPLGVGLGLSLIVAGRFTDRLGPRPIVLTGLLLTGASTLSLTQVGAHTSLVMLSCALLVGGAGIGAALVPSLASPYRGLTRDQIPRATSAIRILQQLGGSFGVAILAVVLQRQLAVHVGSAASLAAAYANTFWWALGFAAVAVVPALLLPATPASAELEVPDAAAA